ncbi:MAG: hypothetical protein CVT72_00075 [Alphaproteobacteria bacterium HGW-Alphaproteobacteria-11]|nr:MAG: hypothetical protein CVT72_00075 [Alphaproteobacteria bacterium HGW-Alphaproteobacteria-11]
MANMTKVMVSSFDKLRSADVTSATLYVFDNTIAVGHVRIDVEVEAIETAADAETLDRLTSSLMSNIIASHMQPVVQRIVSLLRKSMTTTDSGRRISLLRKPENYVVFDDIALDKRGDGSLPNTMLWCNRTIEATEGNEIEANNAAIWLGLDRDHRGADWPRETVQVGSSFFLSAARTAQFVRANIRVQYFYTLLDTLQDSQRRVHNSVFPDMREARLRFLERKIHQVATYTELVLNEFDDYILGLQSDRKIYTDKLCEVFDMPRLIENLQGRSRSVAAKLGRIVEERTERRQRMLQAGIVLIGGLQVMDVLINSIWMAQSDGHIADDGVPGYLDLMSQAPADLVMNIVILAALLIAAGYAFKRRRRS